MLCFIFFKDAIRNEHGREMEGSQIVVEWARGPKVLTFFVSLMLLLCYYSCSMTIGKIMNVISEKGSPEVSCMARVRAKSSPFPDYTGALRIGIPTACV